MNNQVLKFGAQGLKGTTPPTLKVIYRVLIAALAIWEIVDLTFPEIDDIVASYIGRFLHVGTPILYAVSNAFGYVEDNT